MLRDTATAEHGIDQRTTDTAVAVRERVDRLELRVRQRGRRHGREVGSVAERDEVMHVVADQLWRGWNVESIARRMVTSPDPVLHIAEPASVGLLGGVLSHQSVMCAEHVS